MMQLKHAVKRKKSGVGSTKGSEGEQTLSLHLKASKIAFEREFRFYEGRRWRADFKIVDYPILIEVEGGVWSNGRHTRGKGFEGDCEKYNQAAILGYHVLKGSTAQVKSGKLLEDIKQLMSSLDAMEGV